MGSKTNGSILYVFCLEEKPSISFESAVEWDYLFLGDLLPWAESGLSLF